MAYTKFTPVPYTEWDPALAPEVPVYPDENPDSAFWRSENIASINNGISGIESALSVPDLQAAETSGGLASFILSKVPDLSDVVSPEQLEEALEDYLTKSSANAQFATKGELEIGLAGKLSESALSEALEPYLTSATAASTYATQAALTSGLASKADSSALSALTARVTALEENQLNSVDAVIDFSSSPATWGVAGAVGALTKVRGAPGSTNLPPDTDVTVFAGLFIAYGGNGSSGFLLGSSNGSGLSSGTIWSQSYSGGTGAGWKRLDNETAAITTVNGAIDFTTAPSTWVGDDGATVAPGIGVQTVIRGGVGSTNLPPVTDAAVFIGTFYSFNAQGTIGILLGTAYQGLSSGVIFSQSYNPAGTGWKRLDNIEELDAPPVVEPPENSGDDGDDESDETSTEPD